MSENTVTVVGIDPGSSGKKGTVCVEFALHESNGKFAIESVEIHRWTRASQKKLGKAKKPKPHPHLALHEQLERWKRANVLLVWDAPLTGPVDPDNPGGGMHPTDSGNATFTTRPIENEIKTIIGQISGVSVLGYSGCPHWAITRHMVGLPRLGPFDKALIDLEFDAVFGAGKLDGGKWSKPKIVETHPAVAMWGFLKGILPRGFDNWLYKGGKSYKKDGANVQGSAAKDLKHRKALLSALHTAWNPLLPNFFGERLNAARDSAVNDDNVFDALIAAVLGVLAVTSGEKHVRVYGSEDDGAMLLPICNEFKQMKFGATA